MQATKDIGTEVKLRISVNGDKFAAADGAETIKSPNAAVGTRGANQTLLAYGAFKSQGSNCLPVYSGGSTTRVANITVEALGDAAQAAGILAGLNSDALTALIAK